MDSQQVFLVPAVPQSSNTSSKMCHQNQQTATQMVQQPPQPQCSICGTTQKLLRCAKCKSIYYCSTDHQHLDWPTHKHECRALAKQRLINNRLQQLTNGCGAININAHSNSANCATNDTMNCCHNYSLPGFDSLQQANLKSNSFVLGTNENEILNSKAETVTQNSNRSEYMGSFDANSTTSDQMHNIMIQTNIDGAYVVDDRSILSMNDNSFAYHTFAQAHLDEETLQQPITNQTEPSQQIKCDMLQPHNGLESSQSPLQQQTVLPYPVPQLSNHLINQHEKASSYQIGAAAFVDDNLLETTK